MTLQQAEHDYCCEGCGKPLTKETAWLSDNMADSGHYCFNCAPVDAVRAKDMIQPKA